MLVDMMIGYEKESDIERESDIEKESDIDVIKLKH